jgi:hypothetical protein
MGSVVGFSLKVGVTALVRAITSADGKGFNVAILANVGAQFVAIATNDYVCLLSSVFVIVKNRG